MTYIRHCPKCNKELVYKNKYKCKYSDRNRKLCNSCCQLGIASGRKLPPHQIEFLKQRISPMCGKTHSIETRKKMSMSRKGKPGKPHSEETKRKIRECRSNWIIVNKGGSQYNPNACNYFNKLNKQNGWELRHALNGGEVRCVGYFLDAYDKERNIVVEYDEPKHYDASGQLKNKDVVRQQRIINHLGCRFFRYNERTQMLYEITQTPVNG